MRIGRRRLLFLVAHTLALLVFPALWQGAGAQELSPAAGEVSAPAAPPPAAEQPPQPPLALRQGIEVVLAAPETSSLTRAQVPASQLCWTQTGALFGGGDLTPKANISVREPLECCLKCWQTPPCGAWTFNATNGQCLLKHITGWRQAAGFPSLTSGLVTALTRGLPSPELAGPLTVSPYVWDPNLPAGHVEGSCMVLPNRQASGSIYRTNHSTASAEQCCELCVNEAHCTVWNFCGKPEGCNNGFGTIFPGNVCDLIHQQVSPFNLTEGDILFKQRGHAVVALYPPGYTVPWTSGYPLRSAPSCQPGLPCEHTPTQESTLWNISRQYGVDYETVVLLNWDLTDPNLVYPDRPVNLPCCHASPVDGGSALTGGAVAGIAVGCTTAVALALAGYTWWRRRGRRRQHQRAVQADIERFEKKLASTVGALDTAWHDGTSSTPGGGTLNSAPTFSSLLGSSGPIPELPFASALLSPSDYTISKDPTTGKPALLGRGHYAEVYRGKCGMEPAAIKVIKDAGSGANRLQLLQEVAILKSCRSQYLVGFLGACINEREFVIVTELLPGGTLYRALQAGKVTWYRRGLRIAVDVACGLDYLHRRNIIHLDLKSPNVLLTEHGRAKVADVGLARMVPATQSCLASHVDMGTFSWAAPEQLMGQRCSLKADIYAYGVVLWEICTGLVPSRGHMREVRVPEECPQAMADLIAACMASQPDQRPTAEQIINTLAPLGAPVASARARPTEPAKASGEEGGPAPGRSSGSTPSGVNTPGIPDGAQPQSSESPEASPEASPALPVPPSLLASPFS